MEKIEYALVRSDRKTIEVRILPDGSVQVRAPYRVPQNEIERFLRQKQSWIEKHQAAQLARQHMLDDTSENDRSLDEQKLLYMGKWYTLTTNDRHTFSFDGSTFSVPMDTSADTIREGLVSLMKKLAKAELLPRVQQYASRMQLAPVQVNITSAKTRWGSCSRHAAGYHLSFSWRLMAAPPDAIDYVIVHELCHMHEMNHSAAFWRRVEQYVPDWQTKKEALAVVQTWLEAYYDR